MDYTLDVDQVYTNTAHYLGQRFGWRPVFKYALSRRRQKQRLPSWVPDWSTPVSPIERRRWAFYWNRDPLPEPMTIFGSKSLTFRGLRTSSNNESDLHLLNMDEVQRQLLESKLLLDRYIRFPQGSAVSNVLNRRKPFVGNMEFFETQVITGTAKHVDGQQLHSPAQSQIPQAYSLCFPDKRSGALSSRWGYLPVRDLRARLGMSYAELPELLRVLVHADTPRLVIPQHSIEWRFIVRGSIDGSDIDVVYDSEDAATDNGNTPEPSFNVPPYVYSVILGPKDGDFTTGTGRKCTLDLLGIDSRLDELMTGNSRLPPDPQRATRMAAELLEANYLLELCDICIV